MDKDQLVCDRCGAYEGTCIYRKDDDYVLETREQFKEGAEISAFMICTFGVAVCILCSLLVKTLPLGREMVALFNTGM